MICRTGANGPEPIPTTGPRCGRGIDAASKQINALLAIEEAYQHASGEEAKQLAAAGVEDARNGEAP